LQCARAALAAANAADLRRHLHSLAGSAAMVGAPALHRLAKSVEGEAEAGAFPAVEAGLGQLEALFARFLQETDPSVQG
jgi:HPt (histidine-containing phosphotransfer) domain-containing protein